MTYAGWQETKMANQGLMGMLTTPLFGGGPDFGGSPTWNRKSDYGFLPGRARTAGQLQRMISQRMSQGYGPQAVNTMQGIQNRRMLAQMPAARESLSQMYAKTGGSASMPQGAMARGMGDIERAYAKASSESAEQLALENELAKERAMAAGANYVQMGQAPFELQQRDVQAQQAGRLQKWLQAMAMKADTWQFKSKRDQEMFQALIRGLSAPGAISSGNVDIFGAPTSGGQTAPMPMPG